MALIGHGRFVNRPTVTGGKRYDKFFIYVPTEVAKDSQFPLESSDTVRIRVDVKRGRLIVDRANP